MQITFTPGRKLFRILLHGMEYAFAVNSHGELISLHWGAPMNSDDDYELLMPDLNTTCGHEDATQANIASVLRSTMPLRRYG